MTARVSYKADARATLSGFLPFFFKLFILCVVYHDL